jgi:hypothetical protein
MIGVRQSGWHAHLRPLTSSTFSHTQPVAAITLRASDLTIARKSLFCNGLGPSNKSEVRVSAGCPRQLPKYFTVQSLSHSR